MCMQWFAYGSKTWSVEEKDVLKLDRYDLRKVTWMCIDRFDDRVSAKELRNRLKFNKLGDVYRIEGCNDLVY